MNDLERLNNAAKGLKSSNARVLAALQEVENATKNLIKALKYATTETRLNSTRKRSDAEIELPGSYVERGTPISHRHSFVRTAFRVIYCSCKKKDMRKEKV